MKISRVRTVVLAGALLGLSTLPLASPAQALPWGSVQGYYNSEAECDAVGFAGFEVSWSEYACTRQWAPPGMWVLYVVTDGTQPE